MKLILIFEEKQSVVFELINAKTWSKLRWFIGRAMKKIFGGKDGNEMLLAE